MKIILKELRETFICLKIIHRLKLFRSEEKVNLALTESNELIFPIYRIGVKLKSIDFKAVPRLLRFY